MSEDAPTSGATPPGVRRLWAAAGLVTLAGVFDVVAAPGLALAGLYPIALVAAAFHRDRRVIWALAATTVALVYLGAAVDVSAGATLSWPVLLGRTVFAASLVVLAFFVDVWIGSQNVAERSGRELAARNAALEASNHEISAREEEIARQNEELQSQSEELERQSEELRATNDDLAIRERMLAQLLTLSRLLATELTSDEVMQTVCEWLIDLFGDKAEASALLLRHDGELRSHCHFGFGDEGPRETRLRYERTFASLVLARGQSAYLQDAKLRPELVLLEPRQGERFRSVLAAPLVVRGRGVGVLEVYRREVSAWSDEEVNLISSIAAQASLSLETARLFEEVSQERRRFETVFRTLPIAVFSCDDPRCEQVSGNPAASALFVAPLDANLSPFSPLGARIHGGFSRQGRSLVRDELPIVRAVLRGEEVLAEEVEALLPNGRRAHLLMSSTPFQDAKGAITGGVCVAVDITAQKEAQHELDVRRRESEESNARKTRFLAAVSHDIRTPTNAIRLQADLIKRCATDDGLRGRVPELAERLDRNATALVELIEDVLDLTRFDSARIELEESVFSLGDALLEECQHLAPIAEAKGLVLACEPPDPAIWLRTDRVKLGRVLGNLIENAIKFTEAGEVAVSVVPTETEIELRVRDTGTGIAPEDQERIFDEFFQLRNRERDASKGRGLGLAICRRLAEALGTTLRLESAPGRGSTFVVALPRSRLAAGSAVGARTEVDVKSPASLGAEAAIRVLVVEDHDDTRTTLAERLRAEGIVVEEARDGADALRLLDEAAPNVLVLDLMLPDLHGSEILRAIREHRPASLRRVLVVTGDLARNRRAEIEALGADAMLEKPVHPSALLAAVRAVSE